MSLMINNANEEPALPGRKLWRAFIGEPPNAAHGLPRSELAALPHLRDLSESNNAIAARVCEHLQHPKHIIIKCHYSRPHSKNRLAFVYSF